MIGGIGETDIKQSPHNLAKKNLPFENGKLKDSILRTEISDFELDDEIFNLTIQRIIDEAKAEIIQEPSLLFLNIMALN